MNARLALVVVLALSAGCSTFTPTGPTPTVTPAPVPAAVETTETSPLPPGVTGNGITDAQKLAVAHVAETRNVSYTWRDHYVSERRLASGSLRTDLTQIARVETESTYTYWTNRRADDADGPFSYLGNFSEYADRRGRYARFVDDGEVVHRQYPRRPAHRRVGRFAGNAIRQYLSVENASVAVTLVDGQRYYAVEGSGYDLPSGWEISNYTVDATISPDGFVRRLNASYVRTRGDERETIRYGYAYSSVGNTTVEQPSWVGREWPDAAVNASANATATP